MMLDQTRGRAGCCWNEARDRCARAWGEPCGCACHREVEVTLHGRCASGIMPVELRDALAGLVEAVVRGIEDGSIPTRRRLP